MDSLGSAWSRAMTGNELELIFHIVKSDCLTGMILLLSDQLFYGDSDMQSTERCTSIYLLLVTSTRLVYIRYHGTERARDLR